MATASSGRGALSRFAHFAGISKSKAEETATTEEVEDVEDKVDKTQENVEEIEDRVDDLEDRVNDVEEEQDEDAEDDKVVDPDEPPADKPDARKAYRQGKAAGRKAERNRAGAIMSTKAAASNPVLAMHLAFDTGSSPKAALATLRAARAGAPVQATVRLAPAKPGLDNRMAGKSRLELGSGGDAGKPDLNTPEGVAANALAVARRAGVIK